jgi:hypothetical protein
MMDELPAREQVPNVKWWLRWRNYNPYGPDTPPEIEGQIHEEWALKDDAALILKLHEITDRGVIWMVIDRNRNL